MNTSITFRLSFPERQTHYVHIDMHIQGFSTQKQLDIKMPVWAPGSYLIREYAKNVERFSVQDEQGIAILHEKTDKNTWRIWTEGQDVHIRYSVYAFERSVRTSFIDAQHAFLSPVGIFFYIDGYLTHPAHIMIDLPPTWSKVSSGLPRIAEQTFYTENFDILYDSPIEVGNQDTWLFDVDGTLHECCMVGKADYDRDQLTADITAIVQEENKIWGSNPNDYYLFITHHSQSGSGGLEHLNSTVLATPRFHYANPVTYKAYLSLVAHEYFHLWNVKRLRPKALGPFNYNVENYTTALWIMEGFTAYYDNLIIRRCGFYDEKEYLQQLAQDFNTVYNRPGYTLQSAAAASFDAWIKQYRPDENSHNTSISYYNKGAMLAAALDTKIIAHTEGHRRLDDVVRAAYEKFYLIENRGFEEAEFQRLAEEIVGTDLSDIFRAAHELVELDYNRYFHAVGYELIDSNQENKTLSLGIKTVNNDTRVIIKNIDRDSAAWQAGLSVDDELIAINDHRIDGNGKAIDHVLATVQAGDEIRMIVARDGIIEYIPVTLQYANKKSFVIQRMESASDEQRRLGDIWLSL